MKYLDWALNCLMQLWFMGAAILIAAGWFHPEPWIVAVTAFFAASLCCSALRAQAYARIKAP